MASELTEAIDHDAASYDAVMTAFKLPPGDARESKRAKRRFKQRLEARAEVPMQVAERTVALFERLGQLATIAAASMKSDLEVARLMAAAGAKGAMANVEINLDGTQGRRVRSIAFEKMAALRERLGGTSRASSA